MGALLVTFWRGGQLAEFFADPASAEPRSVVLSSMMLTSPGSADSNGAAATGCGLDPRAAPTGPADGPPVVASTHAHLVGGSGIQTRDRVLRQRRSRVCVPAEIGPCREVPPLKRPADPIVTQPESTDWWVCGGGRVREKGLLICDDVVLDVTVVSKTGGTFCVCIIAQSGPVRNDLRS